MIVSVRSNDMEHFLSCPTPHATAFVKPQTVLPIVSQVRWNALKALVLRVPCLGSTTLHSHPPLLPGALPRTSPVSLGSRGS